MKELLFELAPKQGGHSTKLDGVKLFRFDQGLPHGPLDYRPRVCFLASGKRKGYLHGKHLSWESGQFLVLASPTPLEATTELDDSGEPVVGGCIEINTAVLAELAHQANVPVEEVRENGSTDFCPAPLDPDLSDAFVRLLSSLRSKADSAVLGTSITREIVYRILKGPQRRALYTMLNGSQRWKQVYAAVDWIHGHYSTPLNIPEIADRVCMSISAFHHSFKEVIGQSPQRYMKAVRLQRAYLYLRYDGLTASLAASKVGYESPSQFSRDFKQFFGQNLAQIGWPHDNGISALDSLLESAEMGVGLGEDAAARVSPVLRELEESAKPSL